MRSACPRGGGAPSNLSVAKSYVSGARLVARPCQNTGAHDAGADREDAKSDEEAPCVVAIAVGSSASTVVVDRSAARRSPTVHLWHVSFARARVAQRVDVIDTVYQVRAVEWPVRATASRANTPRRSRGPGDRVLVHA